MEDRTPERLTAREGRRFALPVGTAFLLLAGLLWWRGHGATSLALSVVGGVLILAGLAIPRRLGPVYRAWMGFAILLSKVTGPLFMGITFFLVVTPIALLMRASGRNPVARAPVDGSFWIRRPEGGGRRSNLSRQF